MNKVVKAMLNMLGINLVIIALICVPPYIANGRKDMSWLGEALFSIKVVLITQLVVGLILALGKVQKQTGQGMLLTAGIILLIDFVLYYSGVFPR